MRVLLVTLVAALLQVAGTFEAVAKKYYSIVPPGFMEYQVQRGDTWDSLTAGPEEKVFVMKVNRMNIRPWRGLWVLLPASPEAFEYIPVPTQIDSAGRHLVIFEREQYFGAYEDGRLLRWGPVSSGKGGSTPNGEYTAKVKYYRHWSSLYNNARMHFAVQFKGNYFTHEQQLPGYPASRGCVRMMWDDAKWKYSWIRRGDKVSIVHSTQSL